MELDKRQMNKAQLPTRGIKNCRDSRLFKGCSPLQLLCNLTGNCTQSATFHTANRYKTFKTNIILVNLNKLESFESASDKGLEIKKFNTYERGNNNIRII